MSRALTPVIASKGSAQNGWSMLVSWSPYATAMIIFDGLTPASRADCIAMGPCTPHWPPPEGMKKLITPAEMNV